MAGRPSPWMRRAIAASAWMLALAPPAGAGFRACAPPDAVREAAVVSDAGSLATPDGREILLAGIAPARAGAEDGADLAAGQAAGLPAGALGFVPVGAPDRYGRLPAMVFAGAALLQGDLVRAGLAIVRPAGLDRGCAAALLALEAAARTAGAGRWSDAGIVARATDHPSLFARNGLYAVVEGRVVSVGYGSRMVFLDFGREYRTDFTVMVLPAMVSRLRDAGIAVESLTGRLVRVRGVIEESGGPAIRLTDPLALELLDGME